MKKTLLKIVALVYLQYLFAHVIALQYVDNGYEQGRLAERILAQADKVKLPYPYSYHGYGTTAKRG